MLAITAVMWLSMIGVPLIFIAILLYGRFSSRRDITLQLALTAIYLIWVAIVGRWDWTSIYLRWVMLLLFAGLLPTIIRRRRQTPPLPLGRSPKSWFSLGLNTVLIIMFSLWTIQALLGYAEPEGAVDLNFPLASGQYYIAHGGASQRINHHNGVGAQHFAMDIHKLSKIGNRAKRLLPQIKADYNIYGMPVFAPCEGEVQMAVDGLPDQPLWQPSIAVPAGNHVWLRCGTVDVLLGHLKPQSITVKTGDSVRRGQLIAQVGNSGNSTAPHLHFHAQRATEDPPDLKTGTPLPIRIGGRFLVRNSLQ